MRACLMSGLVLALLAGCGGGGGSSGGGGTGGAPTPVPSPSPSPSPSPTPTPSVILDPGGAKLGGLLIPGTLNAAIICTSGQVSRTNGRISDVSKGDVGENGQLTIAVDANFTYSLEFNGFGGVTYDSADGMGGEAFEVFVGESDGLQDELQIAKSTVPFGTYGLATYVNLCFFTAAPFNSAAPPTEGAQQYGGFADGLAQIGADDDRLFGSQAELRFDPARSRYDLALSLSAVENAFAEPAGQDITYLGDAVAELTLANGSFASAPISGPPGFSGTVTGRLAGENYSAALLTFKMSNAAGDLIWGVIVADIASGPIGAS